MIGHYILGADGEPLLCDPVTWMNWFEAACQNLDLQIAFDAVGASDISTVFLSVDRSMGMSREPVLWETAIFGGALGGARQHYRTRAEALAGHELLRAAAMHRNKPEGGTPMTIRFGIADEFVEELRLEGATVERRIVRVTKLFKGMKIMPLQEVSIVGTAIAGGHILRFEQRIGEHMPGGSDSTVKVADDALANLAQQLRAADFEVRAGIVES